MHAIHDFRGKLRQPGVATTLAAYVAWRRALAKARIQRDPDPVPPEIAPISINLDLTTACNYRCAHCIDWDILNTPHRYQAQELRESMRLMSERGLRSVILIGGGEPTLFPRFADFVGYLKRLGLQVAIVSNGSRTGVLADAAVHLDERDWIRLSLDSGSNELFAAMHNPSNPQLTLDAICEGIPKIKRANPRVRVGFSYIVVWTGASRDDQELRENIHEIVPAAERARRAGFDYIGFKPILERRPDGSEVMDPFKAEREFDEVVDRVRTEVDRARSLADQGFDVYESINLRMLEEGSWREFTRQPRTCHMQALRQVLTPTGLFNCPAHRGVAKARIAGPDAFKDGDSAAATGAELSRILDDFDASRECREVTCLYNGVNWWIEKLVQDPTVELQDEVDEERLDYFL